MRPVHKWREARKRMSALARLADRIWETRPVDHRRRRVAADAAAAAGVLPPTQLKSIVALGDGLFSGAFPKKPFARELAVRGPTLIVDEYFTFQRCPCGHPLEYMPARAAAACLGPTDASRRPRHHTGSGGPAPCCAMLPFSDKGTDRHGDELAAYPSFFLRWHCNEPPTHDSKCEQAYKPVGGAAWAVPETFNR